MIEERAADEAFDRDGLGLASETPDEAAVVVGPSTDAVAIPIVRIGALQDLVLGQLGK